MYLELYIKRNIISLSHTLKYDHLSNYPYIISSLHKYTARPVYERYGDPNNLTCQFSATYDKLKVPLFEYTVS